MIGSSGLRRGSGGPSAEPKLTGVYSHLTDNAGKLQGVGRTLQDVRPRQASQASSWSKERISTARLSTGPALAQNSIAKSLTVGTHTLHDLRRQIELLQLELPRASTSSSISITNRRSPAGRRRTSNPATSSRRFRRNPRPMLGAGPEALPGSHLEIADRSK